MAALREHTLSSTGLLEITCSDVTTERNREIESTKGIANTKAYQNKPEMYRLGQKKVETDILLNDHTQCAAPTI